MGFFVWELDLKRKILRLKYLLHQDLRGKLHFQVKEFPLWKGNSWNSTISYQKQKLPRFAVVQDSTICHYIRQQLYYQNPYWMKKQEEAYHQGDNLLNRQLDDWYPRSDR